MYDSVGVYDFENKPICLREIDLRIVFTSKLLRTMDTAEKTFNQTVPSESYALFNEFERKVIQFPNIKLPRQFWSVSTRALWMMDLIKKVLNLFPRQKTGLEELLFFWMIKREMMEKWRFFPMDF